MLYTSDIEVCIRVTLKGVCELRVHESGKIQERGDGDLPHCHMKSTLASFGYGRAVVWQTLTPLLHK